MAYYITRRWRRSPPEYKSPPSPQCITRRGNPDVINNTHTHTHTHISSKQIKYNALSLNSQSNPWPVSAHELHTDTACRSTTSQVMIGDLDPVASGGEAASVSNPRTSGPTHPGARTSNVMWDREDLSVWPWHFRRLSRRWFGGGHLTLHFRRVNQATTTMSQVRVIHRQSVSSAWGAQKIYKVLPARSG